MDNGTLALLIPVLAISVGLVAVVSSHFQKMAKLKMEDARARMGEGGGDVQALARCRSGSTSPNGCCRRRRRGSSGKERET